MARTLAHRGPDQEGAWASAEAGIALGFRRLAIVDLSKEGHQPMASESGRYVITFNGEVYNFPELRRRLEGLGHRFRGHSDTEVLLAGFEAWGVEETLPLLNGMFAFAVWDAQERTVTLARDPLGIKPLYLYREAGLVAWGSELKALVAGPSFDRSLDPAAVEQFLRYLYVPAPLTIYQNARKLLPGTFLRLRDAGAGLPEPNAYWSVSQVFEGRATDRLTSPDECVERLDALLREAVKMQMVSDVPLGALLSGGIDSSTVVALMQEVSDQVVKTFTIGFDEGEHDESEHARAVARHLGTDHTELRLSAGDALEVVPMLPEMFDEPHADPSQIPTYLVSKLAREHVTVALTGDGGDELFGGYNRYLSGPALIRRLQNVPPVARRVAAGILRTVPPSALASGYKAGARLLPGREQRLVEDKIRKVGHLLAAPEWPEMVRSLMSAWQSPHLALRERGSAEDRAVSILSRHGGDDLVEAMMLSDQSVYLPDDLLAKVDRASMAVSLEARVPLLDHRVVELAWRMPMEAKIRDGKTKWALRQVLFRRIPRELVERPKTGFSVPIDAWLKGPLREWAGDLLTPSSLSRCGILEPAPVARAWSEFQSGRTGGLEIWAVLVLQAWSARWA